MKERLLEIRNVADLDLTVRLIEGKIAHLHRRANMPPTRLFRIPQILRELITLRYHRYSRGHRDLIKDLLERDRTA